MIALGVGFFGRAGDACALALLIFLVAVCPAGAASLRCVEISSSGSTSCTDAGGVASTCASAKCPAEMTLTGAGGACDAGDRKIKSLVPRVQEGIVTIACEQQGVAPAAIAVCCQLQ